VPGFPFDIVYLRIESEVYVVAYDHERRRPGYWEDRVSSWRRVGREGPVGVLACAGNTELGVFQMQDHTIPAPSAHVAGPAKVEYP
jgi:hypothetical protein